jgi:hypothetical protein
VARAAVEQVAGIQVMVSRAGAVQAAEEKGEAA